MPLSPSVGLVVIGLLAHKTLSRAVIVLTEDATQNRVASTTHNGGVPVAAPP